MEKLPKWREYTIVISAYITSFKRITDVFNDYTSIK